MVWALVDWLGCCFVPCLLVVVVGLGLVLFFVALLLGIGGGWLGFIGLGGRLAWLGLF